MNDATASRPRTTTGPLLTYIAGGAGGGVSSGGGEPGGQGVARSCRRSDGLTLMCGAVDADQWPRS
jgi:hypothetical protein